MEFLIPGLILVALMAYASTRIKKRAAAAFEPEVIETESYSLQKPDGFLHVIGDRDHDFCAYSNEFGEFDESRLRRATIEIDVLRDTNIDAVVDQVRETSTEFDMPVAGEKIRRLETTEASNEVELLCVYKIVDAEDAIYALRFAVLSEYFEDYSTRIEETLQSFNLKN
jgi:hypothetical protein